MTLDLKSLREKAVAAEFKSVEAIPGEMKAAGEWLCYADEPMDVSGDYIASFASEADANYFCAANPQTVLAMIDRIEELEGYLSDLREAFDEQ